MEKDIDILVNILLYRKLSKHVIKLTLSYSYFFTSHSIMTLLCYYETIPILQNKYNSYNNF